MKETSPKMLPISPPLAMSSKDPFPNPPLLYLEFPFLPCFLQGTEASSCISAWPVRYIYKLLA